MAKPTETEDPKADKAKPKLKLPAFKLPAIKLPAVKLPPVDLGMIAGGIASCLIAGLASILAVHLFLPQRNVEVVHGRSDVAVGRAFNELRIPGFTVGQNVTTDFVSHMSEPSVNRTAYIHPQATLLGSVEIGANVFVAPQASLRGDEGQEIHIGQDSAVLDGVVVRGRPTETKGEPIENNQVRVINQRYSVYVGQRVALEPQCQIYGPAIIDDDTYIGGQALVDRAMIGKHCVLEPRAAVIGVAIGEGHYVPAGVIVRTQTQAEILPLVNATYPLRDASARASRISTGLASGYNALHPRELPPPEE